MLLSFKKIIKMYENGAVQVCGLRGSGKDLLTANVIARRRLPYMSNLDYGYMYFKFNYNVLASGNTYKNFIENSLNKYEFPLCDRCDIYLSDCGIYFPSQYCGELNRDYKDLPVFMALSRQLGLCNVHCNSQYIGRVWDKIREQGDKYIMCLKLKFICGFVFQKIRVYEKYESCANNVRPLRLVVPLFSRNARSIILMEKQKFLNANGKINDYWLIYKNKGKYKTRAFKDILAHKD